MNKLSHSLNARAKPSLQLKFDQSTSRTKKIFALGPTKNDPNAPKKKGSLSDGMSSDYSSDDENRTNIFEPTLDNFENTQHYLGKLVQDSSEQEDCDLIENPLYTSKIEPTEIADDVPETSKQMAQVLDKDVKRSVKTPIGPKMNPFDTNTEMFRSRTPEIQVDQPETSYKPAPPNSLGLSQKLSHSSSDVTIDSIGVEGANYHMRSNSQHDITLNIAQSHSESALRQLKNMASPVGMATREMVLSPLSKLAKGVQNLGVNLDPRKMSKVGVLILSSHSPTPG